MPAYRTRNAVARSALFVAALCATPPAFAQHAAMEGKAEAANATAESAKKAAPPARAQQAATSAKTGTLREPTRAEIEVLIEGMKPYVDTSVEGLTPVYHEDGTVSVDLEGRFQNVTIARMEADGTISQTCVQSQNEARRFLTQKTKASAKRSAMPATSAALPPKAKPVLAKPVLEDK